MRIIKYLATSCCYLITTVTGELDPLSSVAVALLRTRYVLKPSLVSLTLNE